LEELKTYKHKEIKLWVFKDLKIIKKNKELPIYLIHTHRKNCKKIKKSYKHKEIKLWKFKNIKLEKID
jgi:hypothetical protein